jgi:hypothetical protein
VTKADGVEIHGGTKLVFDQGVMYALLFNFHGGVQFDKDILQVVFQGGK